MDKIFQQDLIKEEKVGGIFIRAEDLIPRRSASGLLILGMTEKTIYAFLLRITNFSKWH